MLCSGGIRCCHKNTSELFSEPARACASRAYPSWANRLQTRSRRAGSHGLVPACWLHEGLGASLHSWNAFRLCLAQEAGRLTLEELLEEGRVQARLYCMSQGAFAHFCSRSADFQHQNKSHMLPAGQPNGQTRRLL